MNKPQSIVEIWVYLTGSPLLALFVTLCAYQIGLWIYQRSRQNPLANPVAIAVLLVALFITLAGMSYSSYFAGAQFVHFLLGSATVALAIPIYRGIGALRARAVPLLLSLLAGALTSIVSAVSATETGTITACTTSPLAHAPAGQKRSNASPPARP